MTITNVFSNGVKSLSDSLDILLFGFCYARSIPMVLHEDGRILEVGLETRGNGDIVSGRGMDKEVCELCFS